MANIIISRTANLDRPGNTEFLSGTLFADENLAHTFAISATRNGAEIALSGVVTACFIRPDGGTVELNGTIEDGKACVTLAESCYVVTGRFKLTVFVSVDGAKTAVYCAAGNVVETTTNTIIDPGSVVPSVDDIIAEYATMQQAVEDCEDAAEAANTAATAADAAAAGIDAKIATKASVTEPCIINMFDYFWANGGVQLSSLVQSDSDADSKYLLVSGEEGDTVLTVAQDSPLAVSDLYSYAVAGVLEYDDGTVDLVSVYVDNGDLTIYPALKADVTGGKIYSLAVSIHLSAAGYKYYTDCFYGANLKYTRKRKAIAQYNPYSAVSPNPLTKIGTYWWGKGTSNMVLGTYRVIDHFTTDYLNMSFVTGATEQSPKGFEWQVTLDGKSGYFEMYLGGRDTTPLAGDFAEGLAFTIEFYLDGTLVDTIVKTSKKCEPIRFDFSGAQTGKVRMTVTSGASTYAAHLTQATWWETDEANGDVFDGYRVPCMLMDSWGVYHDNAVQTELETLLAADSGMAVPVINNSLGSQTSAWGVEHFYDKVWAERPGYMISDFGINDVNTNVPAATYIANMKKLIDAAVKNGIEPVMLLTAHATPQGTYNKYTFPLIAALTEIQGGAGE